jgi:hypothetical protein
MKAEVSIMAENQQLLQIVDAIQDLTRVTLALHGGFASKSEAIRRLSGLSIPPARIAALLAMPTGDVHSALAKAKKRPPVEADDLNPRKSRDRAMEGANADA